MFYTIKENEKHIEIKRVKIKLVKINKEKKQTGKKMFYTMENN